MNATRLFASLLVSSLLSGKVLAQPAVQEPVSSPDILVTSDDTTAYNVLAPILRESNGSLTPKLREAYLQWAETSVLHQIKATRHVVSDDCLAEIHADSDLRDAIFGAVYPPDPNILLHYDELRSELGVDFTHRYRGLVVGVAVARRYDSLGAVPLIRPFNTPAERKLINNPVVEIADATESLTPEDDTDNDTDKPLTWPHNDAVVVAATAFLKANRYTALEVWNDQGKKEELIAFLNEQKIEPKLIAGLKKLQRFQDVLRGTMILMGLRPPQRDPQPGAADWLRYITTLNETPLADTPKNKKGVPMPWPLLPLKQVPWPLAMPFGKTVPLTEGRYIWETFQGQHGENRYHLYGPYRHPVDWRSAELQPSQWHWEAWPDSIVHGGVCILMGQIGCQTHLVLGEPAIMAVQPGHVCLITYGYKDGAWIARVEQDYSGGPSKTLVDWPFQETVSPRESLRYEAWHKMHRIQANFEYPLGTALAMNAGLHSYMDTRIAVHLYRILPPEERRTIGVKLLTQAIKTNPFNPEPWYQLAAQTANVEEGMSLVDLAKIQWGKDGSPLGKSVDAEQTEQRDISQSLEAFIEQDRSKSIKESIATYWSLLAEVVTENAILRHPVPLDDAAARRVYDYIQIGVPGLTPAQMMPYWMRFESKRAVQDDLLMQVHNHLTAKKNSKKKTEYFTSELTSYLAYLSPEERAASLAELQAPLASATSDDALRAVLNKAATPPKKRKKK